MAQRLYDDGVAAMKEQPPSWARAADRFLESYRLDPQPGTLYLLAVSEENLGKLATAAARYGEYLTVVKTLTPERQKNHKERAVFAEARIKDITPQIPLVIPSVTGARGRLKGFSLGGVSLRVSTLGVPLPIDPGEHLAIAELDDGTRIERRFRATRGERTEFNFEIPDAAPPSASASAPPAASSSPPPPALPPTPPALSPSSTPPQPPASVLRYPLVARGSLVFTAVAVSFGVFAGVRVFSEKQTLSERCDGLRCDADGKAAADRAQRYASISNVAFSLGALGAGASLLLFSWKTPESPAVSLTPGRGGAAVSLQGRFLRSVAPLQQMRLDGVGPDREGVERMPDLRQHLDGGRLPPRDNLARVQQPGRRRAVAAVLLPVQETHGRLGEG